MHHNTQTEHYNNQTKSVHEKHDSAIYKFSKAFSNRVNSQLSRLSLTKPQQHSTPVSPAVNLPTELLLAIFRLVYNQQRTSRYSFHHDKPPKVIWKHEEPLLPTLFPFALAAVCCRWCDVLAGVPEYWTRMVVLVDENPTDTITITSCLQWSGDLPLSVTITRANLDPSQHDEGELQRSRIVYDLHRPHLARIESLTVSVLHSSALPDIFTDLDGPAGQIETLKLVNVVDDDFTVTKRTSPKSKGPLDAPLLDALTIRGHCFRDKLLGNSLQTSRLINLTSISIAGYRPPDGSTEGLHLWMTLQTLGQLPRLDDLTLADIRFDANRRRYTGPPISLPRLHTVAFEKLASVDLKDIHSIIEGIHLSSTIITDCTVETFTNINSTDYLTFERMSRQDLTLVLDSWFGYVLTLRGSTCVDNQFFREMARDLASAPGGTSYFAAPNLKEVVITNCDRFSLPALRHWIQQRRRSNAVSSIRDVHVSGRGPAITEEYAEWFRENLEMFTWNTVQSDGKRYRVDAYSSRVYVI
ncbi:hypothetical protein HYDPIDRAFT_112737 [Hydnomerulius pinastri MD-312]|uniref:F-box domain-containing protein n=1 Tax=Hydnomerulius pinastri MD-312 TaxID=994086 RepID=A0A0C9VZC7_9AGAM|nr:hypothetical protein HYDPIDRAFT_112737 [Hydnomerulius pinastri MD-312]